MAIKASDTMTLASVKDVASVTPYYLAQTSTLSPPSKPTANPPTGWSTTQPALNTSKTCYIVFLNVFSDGTWAYSDVSTMSEYEAAKAAQNTATAAATAVAITSQHFWHNTQDSGAGEGVGAHITEVPQEDFIDDPANGGGNLLAQSGGIAIRDGITELATFGASGAVIGTNDYGESRVTIDNNGIALKWKPADPEISEQVPFEVDLAGAMSLGPAHTVTGSGSAAIGDACEASGEYSVAIGQGAAAVSYTQLAVGEFNKKDTANKYALIVGGGSDTGSRANVFAVARTGNVEMAGGVQSFFKIVDLSWSEPSISAHSYGTNTTHTVPSANRPDGMTLVGIVGWTSGNYRIYPYVFNVNGSHSISVTMANATNANSAAATIHVKLLYIKATSA